MISQSNKILFSLFICFSTLIEPVFCQNTFEFRGNREAIPFKKARGLIIVPMYINNKGPFNFILDTGVGSVIITDPDLKDSLNLQFLRKMELSGLGEELDVKAFSVPFLNLKVGSTEAKSSSVAILAKDVFNLSAYTGIPIHGLLGYDFFNSFSVRINYESGILKIYKNHIGRLIKKGHKIPISIEGNKPYMNVLVHTTNQQQLELKVLIDIGSGHPLSLESYKNQAFPLPVQHVSANLGVGLNGKINGFKGRIATLQMGNFILNDVLTSFPNYESVAKKTFAINRNGSIGNTLFKKFDVLFDYKNSCIYLKRGYTFKEPFEQDMSGMELATVGDDFDRYFVTRVEKGSPADEFGIIEGDEIVSLNFTRTSKLNIDEITRILSSRDGRTLFLDVERKGEAISGILTLRRRI